MLQVLRRVRCGAPDRCHSVDGNHSAPFFFGDIDCDGDFDIISAYFYDETIAWHENYGAAYPIFTASDIAGFVQDPNESYDIRRVIETASSTGVEIETGNQKFERKDIEIGLSDGINV